MVCKYWQNAWYLSRTYPGLIQERISYRDRYFIPTGEKGIEILNRILEYNPVRNTSEEEYVQYQRRNSSHGNFYDTEGVHWGLNQGIMDIKEARKIWAAIADIQKRRYNYPTTVQEEHIIPTDSALFFVDTDYRYPSVNKIIRFNEEYKINCGYAKELIIDARGNPARHREALQNVEDIFGEGYAVEYDRTVYQSDAWEDRGAEGENRRDNHQGDFEQKQQRTNTLTDRDVLAIAANDLNTQNMSEAEREKPPHLHFRSVAESFSCPNWRLLCVLRK